MWTSDALRSELRRYRRAVWRIVADEYRATTLRLTDNWREQEILEGLIEEAMPDYPAECHGLDGLLFTPFRYRPARYASRFRRAGSSTGVFYAAEAVTTAAAERARTELLIYRDSPGTPMPSHPLARTAFSVRCATQTVLDLLRPPLDRDEPLWMHPSEYGPCQDLAHEAHTAGARLIRYRSVRDPKGRANVAILSCAVFRDKAPTAYEAWQFLVRHEQVQAWGTGGRKLEFTSAQLL